MSSSNSSRRRRMVLMGTSTVAAFALTLLVAGLVILTNSGPVRLPVLQRTEIGAFLFFMPLVALSLALIVEVTRIALGRKELPTTVEVRRIDWAEPRPRRN